MMQRYKKQLRVGKRDRYTYSVSGWAGSEAVTSSGARIECPGVEITDIQVSSGVISFFATGVSVGSAVFFLDYATATRSDCAHLIIDVITSGTAQAGDDGVGELFNEFELFNDAELYE